MRDFYFLYVKYEFGNHDMSGVIRLYDDYVWKLEVIRGDDDLLNGVESLDNHYDIDDVMDYLRSSFS